MWLLIAVILIIVALASPAVREVFFSAKGWIRLWILISGVYLLLVIAVAISILKSQSVIEYIAEALLWWIVPVAALYGLGYSIGWVLRGFNKDQ